ncbi:MAG: exonuclease SbcCD subunit D [Clostridia bacterium]|nr:exonuclease SbcCD subunit D [Clostridia bacterium]
MKFIHLSDLHIGKTILEQSIIEDQEYMLNQILEIIKKEKIDAVLIAGDVYDRSVPSSEAVNLLDEFLNNLIKKIKVKVFIISGNHDSKERLNFGSRIFENDGLYIQTSYDGFIRNVSLDDEYGKLNIYMMPFVKPADVKNYFEEEISGYDDAFRKIMAKEEVNQEERNIILTHQFITAGNSEPEKCESETLILGGTENVDISNFDKFDYVAIGHIHGPQRIGRDNARYSGTMLKYSFSEVNHKKSVVVIDFKEKDNLEYKLIPLKPLRDMRVIEGPIEELLKEENYKGTNLNDFIRVIITNEEPVYDAIGQIRRVYPNTLRLDIKNSKSAQNLESDFTKIDSIKQKDELELFDEFFEFQNNVKLNENQKEIMRKIINEVKGV